MQDFRVTGPGYLQKIPPGPVVPETTEGFGGDLVNLAFDQIVEEKAHARTSTFQGKDGQVICQVHLLKLADFMFQMIAECCG